MSQIQFYDTLTATVRTFVPKHGEAKLYCCGVTPYDNTHIGHARTFFCYDLLVKVLKDAGLKVLWARNITDIDDKIIKKATDEGVSCEAIATRYVKDQDRLLEALFLDKPMYEPKVTQTINQIVNHITALISKGYAYVSESGVYFRVHRFEEYGKLSKNKVADLRQGVRIEVDESKEDSVDFALWKFAKQGEEKWPSPWGDGRPGWHIECSAMIHSIFGNAIDIHLGGRDLIFPHHECEIAQSEAMTHEPLAQIWMHVGMMTLNGEKMSKSLGNYIPIDDFLKQYPAEVLRLVFLSTAYGQPIDFSYDLAAQNLKKLVRLYRFVMLLDGAESDLSSTQARADHDVLVPLLMPLQAEMRLALQNNLNAPQAIAHLFDAVKKVNQGLMQLDKKNLCVSGADERYLKEGWPNFKSWMKATIGLLQHPANEFFEVLKTKYRSSELDDQAIKQQIASRNEARAQKDWKRADEIRDSLLAHGVVIQDTPKGTTWSLAI